MANENHGGGWVKLWRQSLESQVFQDASLWKVWTWCLMRASHSERWEAVKCGKGVTEVKLSAGQFVFGRLDAARRLRMKPSSVWGRILKLSEMGNIEILSDNLKSLISITNWDIYQKEDFQIRQRTDSLKPKSKGSPKEKPRNSGILNRQPKISKNSFKFSDVTDSEIFHSDSLNRQRTDSEPTANQNFSDTKEKSFKELKEKNLKNEENVVFSNFSFSSKPETQIQTSNPPLSGNQKLNAEKLLRAMGIKRHSDNGEDEAERRRLLNEQKKMLGVK